MDKKVTLAQLKEVVQEAYDQASNPYPKYIRPSLHCANMVPKKY